MKKIRCAIYTRKSSEDGLEQEFNSLHAQREACAAYVASQKHEGWVLLPDQYDDGGLSGGSLERAALQALLADIRAGKIDQIVVYKIDRLTRSLADFAKIVDILDAAGASFVSVTQSFNTATSMGRLTLNMLLSFAQFEREVTAERIRDKIAASKRRGLWMGGYALTGMTSEHKMLFLYGTGRNGKSVFLNTLFDLFGDYARRAPASIFLNSKFEQHSTGLAGLQGARLVVGSELPKGKSWDEATIKDLTGGDKLTARLMKQDYLDFDPQLTLFIAGNNMPSFAGIDEAIRARVVLVPFTVTIPSAKRDKSLPDKLRAEAQEILRWAIDGALQWQQRGLDVPASITAASNSYFHDEDILGQFLEDETENDTGSFVTTSALHQRFVQWCEQQGL